MSSKSAPEHADLGAVSQAALDKLTREADAAKAANQGVGNALLALREATPGELVALHAEKVELVTRLRAVLARITDLETHALIAEPGNGNGGGA